MFTLTKPNSQQSSRLQINIEGVQQDILQLPGHEFRAVLETSAINFELKSEAEQDALIDTYKSFLNSLPCSIQILLRIREMDLDRYIESFKTRLNSETDKKYLEQIENYSQFVRKLVSTNKILSRRFYIVVPYSSHESTELVVAKEQLKLSCDIITKGLSRLGMRTRSLSSLEILDLFYSFYHPAKSKLQPITDQTLKLLSRAVV